AAVAAGTAISGGVAVIPIRGSGPVTLTAEHLPPGTFVNFDLNPVPTGRNSGMVLQTTIATPAGTYATSIAGRIVTPQGPVDRSASYPVHVTSTSDPNCGGSVIPDHLVFIPGDGTPLNSTIATPSCGNFGPAASVQVFINHPRRGDLVIDLIAPDGS